MKKGRLLKIFLPVFAAAVFLPALSGCTSILLSDEPIVVTTAAAREEEEKKEDKGKERHEEAEREAVRKYGSVPGDRAFYLLPAGVPWPGGICSFQFLEMLSDNTTVYAYQTLYALKDETGRGGMPDQGKKQEDEPVGKDIMPYIPESMKTEKTVSQKISGPADQADRIATFLMTYNFETEEYRILWRDTQEVSVSYIFNGESAELQVNNQIRTEEYGRMDLSQFKAVRVSPGKYAFYYKEHLYTIDAGGHILTDKLLESDFENLMRSHPGEKESLWHVEDLVVDEEGDSCLLVQCVDENSMDSDDMDRLEKGDSSVHQYMLTSDHVEGDQLFTCTNVSANDQLEAFMEANGASLELGVLDSEPTDEEITEIIGTPEEILEEIPDLMSALELVDGTRAYRLYDPDGKGGRIYPTNPEEMDPSRDWHVEVLELDKPSSPVQSDIHIGPRQSPFLLEEQTAYFERMVFIFWTTEEEETYIDDDGNIQTVTVQVDHEKTYSDGIFLLSQWTAVIPDASLSWYWIVPGTRSVSKAPYDGIIHWLSEEPDPSEENSTGLSEIRWDRFGSDELIYGRLNEQAQKILLPRALSLLELGSGSFEGIETEIPLLYLYDRENVSIYYNFQQKTGTEGWIWADSLKVPVDTVSYSHNTDDEGKPTLTFSEGALHLRKEDGKPVLYAGSLSEGLVRVPLGKDNNKGVAKIWPYPCISTRMADEEGLVYIFGFKSESGSFRESDLPFARVYPLDPFDEESCENLLQSTLVKPENFEYRWKLLNLSKENKDAFETAWNELYDSLGIGSGSRADREILEGIRTRILRKWSYIMRFFRLCQLEKTADMKNLVKDTESCGSAEDLESVFITYTTIHVPEEEREKPKGGVELNQWLEDVREAKLKKIRELQNPEMSEEKWQEELRKIADGLQ